MAIGFNNNNGYNSKNRNSREPTRDDVVDDLTSPGPRRQSRMPSNGSGRRQSNNSSQNARNDNRRRPPIEDDLEDLEEDDGFGGKKKLIAAAAAVTAVVIVGAVVFAVSGRKKNNDSSVQVTSEIQSGEQEGSVEHEEGGTGVYEDYTQYDDHGNAIGVDEVTPTPENKYVEGDSNYSESVKSTAPDKIVSSSDYVKNLEGKDVSAVYNVKERRYVKAHVSYTAKRAIIDDGMEMYWLDVDYKGKKYRVQCPFYYVKDLDEQGVCRVEIEVLYLEDGGQVISYMQVIDEEDGDS